MKRGDRRYPASPVDGDQMDRMIHDATTRLMRDFHDAQKRMSAAVSMFQRDHAAALDRMQDTLGDATHNWMMQTLSDDSGADDEGCDTNPPPVPLRKRRITKRKSNGD